MTQPVMTAVPPSLPPSVPLPIAQIEPEQPFVWRHGRWISGAEFTHHVMALATRLPQRPYILNLCEDRYDFMVAFCAALAAGQSSLLPSGRADSALRALLARYPDSTTIASHDCTFTAPDLIRLAPCFDPISEPAPAQLPTVSGDHVAAIAFSSGSTGEPTEHAKTWAMLWYTGVEIAERFALGRYGNPATIVATVPPQHMFGLECSIVLPLAAGLALDAGRPLLPADVAAGVARTARDAWLVTTPLVLRALDAEALAMPGLAGVVSATMPLDPALAERLDARWQSPVREIYGCTEGGSLASRRTRDGDIWTTLPGVRIADAGTGAEVTGGHLPMTVPLADIFEVRSPHCFRLLGRAAHIVKVAGRRTSIEALNQALLALEGVDDGAFFAPNDDEDGRLMAFAVAPRVSSRQLIVALRDHIDAAFLPRPLYLVDAMPRNDLGKLTRAALGLLAAQCAGGNGGIGVDGTDGGQGDTQ